MAKALVFALGLFLVAHASSVSPVQKVIELLDELKGKVQADLSAESKSFSEYATFCDDEVAAKTHAIKTADRQLADLEGAIEDASATIDETSNSIADLSTSISQKQTEVDKATENRKAQNKEFVAEEAELMSTIDELGRGITALKAGQTALLQGKRSKVTKAHWQQVVSTLSKIVDAVHLDLSDRSNLDSFMQSAKKQAEKDSDDDDLELPTPEALSEPLALIQQPQPEAKAFESQGGAIIETMEKLEERSGKTLTSLRQDEMKSKNAYELVKAGLENEVSQAQSKLQTAQDTKASAQQTLEDSNGSKLDTEKSKAADEEYRANLKQECQAKAREWEERSRSGDGEVAAIAKAKEILSSGVTAALTQVTAHRRVVLKWSGEEEHDSARDRLTTLLKDLSRQHSSFALAQLASAAASDPFVKIRGLIESMVAKLEKEAAEDATHEAFCQEELGKSNKQKEIKSGESDKYKARMDSAATTIAELTQAIKTLDSEIAEIDSAQAEATALRNQENADYKQASSDFKGSAEAVARAVEVLKSYYESALLVQVNSKTHRQPAFGGAQSDSAHTIISVLEMAQEDFTTMLAEVEATETQAADQYKKLSDENKMSRLRKETDAKGKASQVKQLKVALEHSSEDYDSASKELDAVNSYLMKLQPECESKGMSYAEKKAARESEVEGLKSALTILEGPSLVQTGRRLRAARKA